METYGTIFMDYEPGCLPHQYFLPDPFQLKVRSLGYSNFLYEGWLHFQGAKHRFGPRGHYVKFQLLKFLTQLIQKCQQAAQCWVRSVTQRIPHCISLS